MKVYIKEWFLNKMEIPHYAIPNQKVDILKETEKAYYILMNTETKDGENDINLHFWVPKKCTMTEEEYQEEESNYIERRIEGEKRYNALIEFCKANNIKGARVGLRKETLMKKIEAAGLTYTY